MNWFNRFKKYMNPPTIDDLINELMEVTDNFIYVEYYSHEDSRCYKIDNPYTHYNKDTLVLGKVDDGFGIALKRAIKEIKRNKKEFYK